MREVITSPACGVEFRGLLIVGLLLLGDEPLRWGASLALIVLMGVLAGVAPVMAVELTGIAIPVVELWAGAFAPTWECVDSKDLVTPIIVFVAAYLLFASIRRRVISTAMIPRYPHPSTVRVAAVDADMTRPQVDLVPA